jgi:hypothetical protein
MPRQKPRPQPADAGARLPLPERPNGEGDPEPPSLISSPGLRRAVQSLTRYDLRLVAIAAFVVGVLIHACVFSAVLDSGGSATTRSDPVRISTAVVAATPARSASLPASSPTPRATVVPGDRSNCADIRNTEYRSPTERQWFLENCTGR